MSDSPKKTPRDVDLAVHILEVTPPIKSPGSINHSDSSLPEGWKIVESRSRPGMVSYENIYTKERQQLLPVKPASHRKKSSGAEKPNSARRGTVMEDGSVLCEAAVDRTLPEDDAIEENEGGGESKISERGAGSRASFRDRNPLKAVKASYRDKKPTFDLAGVVNDSKDKTSDTSGPPSSLNVGFNESLGPPRAKVTTSTSEPLMDLSKINDEASLEKSYRFSTEGTFKYRGYEIREDGIASASEKNRPRNNIQKDLKRLSNIGKGNGGTVYKAVHLPSLQLMALKTISIHVEEARHQMVRELKVLQENLVPLSGTKVETSPCENILGFYDAFTSSDDGSVVMAVEYMNGGSLEDVIKRGSRLNEEELGSVAFQCLRGLAFLNSRKQMHRDIKPGNILLNSKGKVKISDFGTARQVDSSTIGADGAMVNTFVGTVMYMAPERINSNEYSYESDIWSLGLSIYAAADTEFPYNVKKGYWGLASSIVNDPAPHLPDKYFSPSFVSLIDEMLVKDSKKRKRASELLKHPFIIEAIQKSENCGLPIPRFLLDSISTAAGEAKEAISSEEGDKRKGKKDDEDSKGKESEDDYSRDKFEEEEEDDEGNKSDAIILSPSGRSKSEEKAKKRIKELEEIATEVNNYWYKLDKQTSGKPPKELSHYYDKKLSRLANELHFPQSVVKVAFEQAANKLLKRS